MIEYLTTETFKEKVMNFDINNKEWDYSGELPAVIDFYADWCKPCKTISPILEELSEEYKDKIIIYKINVEDENELASMFNVRNIPSVLFIPKEGEPQMKVGAFSKMKFKDTIENVLFQK